MFFLSTCCWLRNFLCLGLLLASVAAFGQSGTQHSISLGDKRFAGMAGKNGKGVLVISTNKVSNNFILDFYNADTSTGWQKEIKNEELGYIETQLISNQLHVFFTDNNIFLVYSPYPELLRNATVYTLTSDYNGNYTISNAVLPANYKLKSVFLNKQIPAVLLEERPDEQTVKKYVADLCAGSKEVCNLQQVSFWESVHARTPAFATADHFVFQASGGGIKSDGSVNAYLHITDKAGKLEFAKAIAVKPEPFFPAMDYELYFATMSHTGSVDNNPYLRILADIERNSYFVYGMFTAKKDAGPRTGFHISRYNFLNEEQFSRKYLFADYPEALPFTKQFAKAGAKITSLNIEPVTGNLLYTVEVYIKKLPEVYCFAIAPDGAMREVKKADSYAKLFTSKNRFRIEGNSDLTEQLAAYYSDCTLPSDQAALNALEAVRKSSSGTATRPVLNVLPGKDNTLITAFSPSENKIVIHHFKK